MELVFILFLASRRFYPARQNVRREHRGPQARADPVVPAADYIVLDAAPHQPQYLAVLRRHGQVGRLDVEQLRHLSGPYRASV